MHNTEQTVTYFGELLKQQWKANKLKQFIYMPAYLLVGCRSSKRFYSNFWQAIIYKTDNKTPSLWSKVHIEHS